MTESGVFSACARLPTWVRARSTISRSRRSAHWFRGQRRDLDREGAFQPFREPERIAARLSEMRFSGARPNAPEHGGDQQHDREHAEGHRDRAIKPLRLVLDLERVTRNGDEIAALIAEIDGSFDQPQPLVLGPGT